MSQQVAKLTFEELNELLLAVQATHARTQEQFNLQLAEASGIDLAEVKEVAAKQNEMQSAVITIVSRRLAADNQAIPLLSPTDLEGVLWGQLHQAMLGDDNEPNAANLRQMSVAVTSGVAAMWPALQEAYLGPDVANIAAPYERMWELVTTIHRLAREHGKPALELVSTPEGQDAILRVVSSAEAQVAQARQRLEALESSGIQVFTQQLGQGGPTIRDLLAHTVSETCWQVWGEFVQL